MLRLTSLFLTLPLVLSLGWSTPARANCDRYRVWDSDRYGYVWRDDCDRSDRNYDRNYDDQYQYSRRRVYRNNDDVWPLILRRRSVFHNRRDRDWRQDRYDRDWQYRRNPGVRIFIGH
jgi:hypothetical protein